MKIKLSEIDVVNKKNFQFKISKLDDINLIKDIEVVGYVEKRGNEYSVEGEYTGEVKGSCVRCMDDVEMTLVNQHFTGKYLKGSDFKDYLDSLEKTSTMDDNYFTEVEDEIDIDELVREQLILDMPQYPTCEPDCKDDTYLKKYANDETDLRWAGLMDIKIKN